MKLKSFTLLLILMISLGTLHAEIHSGTCGANLTWSLNVEDSTLTISGMGEMYNWDYYNPSPWNEYKTLIKVITFPLGLTSIGERAFMECENLKIMTIPENVTHIGNHAFAYCSKLTTINIPNSVTQIGAYAFFVCSNATSLTLSSNVHCLGEEVFCKCSALTIVEIPYGVDTIGDRTFKDCTSLTNVIIPNSVIHIEDQAFRNCISLSSINIPENVTSIGFDAFYGCANLPIVNNIRYADSFLVETVDKTLSTYKIKEGTRWIGNNAFLDCTALTSIICEATTPPMCENYVFRNIDKSTFLYVPLESIDDYKTINIWKDFTNILPIGGYPSISLPIHIELKDNYGRWLSEAAIRNDYDTAFFYSSSFDYSEYVVHAHKTEDNLWRLIGHTTPEYRFIGWKDKNGKVLNQDTLCLYSNDTVIAIVSKQEYHVQVVPDNYLHGYTKAEYGYAGDTTISYGESINVTAIPREGFQFSRWSDGNTDNPREINILGDLYLTAIFDCQRYGGGWPSEILDTITIERGDPVIISNAFPWQRTIYPNETGYFNDTLLTIFGCDSIVTHYVIVTENKFPVIFLNYNGKVLSRQYVRNGMGAEEPEVPVREGYTFTGWTTDIEHIVDTTYAITLYDKIGGTLTYLSEEGDVIATENVDLHLPAAPIIAGKSFKGWLTESVDSESGIVLRATYTTDNPTTHDDVSVVPGSTTAAVNFPYITGALTYELVIRDLFGRVVCKILFNSTGHLLGIALTPGRNRTAAPAQTDGFNFTVEGLDPNTTYNYEFVAHDDTDEVIETLSGSFTTTDEISTGVENVQSNYAQCSKELRDDHVYILRGEKTYTLTGQEVK